MTSSAALSSSIILNQRFDLTEDTRSHLFNSPPAFQFLLGRDKQNTLIKLQLESAPAFQNSTRQLYSLGLNVRTLVGAHILGLYGFWDLNFKENASSLSRLNLCNFNLGLEGMIKSFQISANLYTPLHPHGYCSSDYTLLSDGTDKEPIKDRILRQAYYLESGNFGADINIRKFFAIKKHPVTTSLGSYTFYDQPKKLIDTKDNIKVPRWIIGGTLKFDWQWSEAWCLYSKISLDNTTRPLMASLGIQCHFSTDYPNQSLYQRLWTAPIQRHLSPLLAPEQTNIPESMARHTLFMQQCEKEFQGKELTAIREVATIMHHCRTSIPHLIAEKNEEYSTQITELLTTQDTSQIAESIPRRMHLAIHPDKEKFRADQSIELTTRQRRNYLIAVWPKVLLLALEQNKKLDSTL